MIIVPYLFVFFIESGFSTLMISFLLEKEWICIFGVDQGFDIVQVIFIHFKAKRLLNRRRRNKNLFVRIASAIFIGDSLLVTFFMS